VLASVHGVPELTTIGLCLGATLLVTACGLQSKAALRRRMSIGRLALVDIGAAAAGLSAAWAASAHTTTVILLLVSQVVAAGTATILAIAFAPVRMQRPVAEPAYRNAVGVGWEILGADVLNIVRVQCPVFVLGFVVLVHDIGLFSRANQLLNLPLAVLGPALTNFLLPLLARTQGNDERFRRHVRRTTTLFLLAAIPASVWIAIGPADLVALVLGEDWRPSVPILCWLSPLFASQVVSTVALTTLMAREQSAAVRLFSFWNLALTAIAVVAATPWGITGVAVALAVSGLGIRAPLLIRLAVRAGTMHPADVLLGLRRMVALAAVTAIALGACRLAGPGGPAGDALGLAVCAAISAAGLTFVYLRSIRETTR
jgi:PST family polysaccharide transporter